MKKVLFLAISAGMLHAQTPSEAEIRAILVERIDTAAPECRDRGGDHRRQRPAIRELRPNRIKRPAPGGERLGVRDRVDDEGLHVNDSGGHGEARRGVAGRSGGEVSAERGEDSGARREADHAARSGDAQFGAAFAALELQAEGSEQSVRGLHGGAALGVPGGVPVDARYRVEVRVFEYGCGSVGAGAGAPRGNGLRGAGAGAGDRAVEDGEHADRADAGDEGAAGERGTRRRASRRRTGICRCSPGRARCAATRAIC